MNNVFLPGCSILKNRAIYLIIPNKEKKELHINNLKFHDFSIIRSSRSSINLMIAKS